MSLICLPLTLYFDLKEAFFTEKRLKISNRQSAQKSVQKIPFILHLLMSLKTYFFLFHFLVI